MVTEGAVSLTHQGMGSPALGILCNGVRPRGKTHSSHFPGDHICALKGVSVLVAAPQVTLLLKSSIHTRQGRVLWPTLPDGGGGVGQTFWGRSAGKSHESCVFIINVTLDCQSSGQFRLCIS